MNRFILLPLWIAASLSMTLGANAQTPAAPAAAAANSAPAAPAADTALAEPLEAELLPPKHATHGETRIQQIRRGNRVAEVIVTPAGQSYSFSMQNREGRLPLSPRERDSGMSGLSIPSFLKLEF
jgi:hypothetical protein